nr:hypothetical protein [Deinococcus radiotolerans]
MRLFQARYGSHDHLADGRFVLRTCTLDGREDGMRGSVGVKQRQFIFSASPTGKRPIEQRCERGLRRGCQHGAQPVTGQAGGRSAQDDARLEVGLQDTALGRQGEGGLWTVGKEAPGLARFALGSMKLIFQELNLSLLLVGRLGCTLHR